MSGRLHGPWPCPRAAWFELACRYATCLIAVGMNIKHDCESTVVTAVLETQSSAILQSWLLLQPPGQTNLVVKTSKAVWIIITKVDNLKSMSKPEDASHEMFQVSCRMAPKWLDLPHRIRFSNQLRS